MCTVRLPKASVRIRHLSSRGHSLKNRDACSKAKFSLDGDGVRAVGLVLGRSGRPSKLSTSGFWLALRRLSIFFAAHSLSLNFMMGNGVADCMGKVLLFGRFPTAEDKSRMKMREIGGRLCGNKVPRCCPSQLVYASRQPHK